MEGARLRADTQRQEATTMAEQDISCAMCGGKFKSQAELDAHTKKEHAGTPTEPAKTGEIQR
jgi:hypothetical protein